MNPLTTFNSNTSKNDDNPVSYKGNRPYIFISYSHMDRSRVLPIIIRLQKDGFRVWYDEGIDPGTEWAEFIAAAIDKCGYFFAFISRNYQLSENCKDEMGYVRDLKPPKKRLLIYLEDVQLDGGMKLRQNRLQAIHIYGYASQEKIYEQIYRAVGLNKCHENGRIPSVQALSDGMTEQKNPLYDPKARIKSTWLNGRIYSKKAAVIAIAVVIGILVLRSAVFRLAVPAIQKSTSANASDESGNMDDSYNADVYDDDYHADDSNQDENSAGDTTSGSQDMTSSKDRVKLTSIETPVECVGNFNIAQDVRNTMGTTYEEAVVISDFNMAYVRYNVGDFKWFTGNYSIDNEWNQAENDFDLIVYLDDNEEEPVIDTKVSRSTVETPLDIDVSSAQFITIKIETKDSRGCSLLLTDCYLNKDSSMSGMRTETKTTGTSIAAEKDSIKLTSIETPVECVGSFNIAQDILNTMGTTYEEAVVISDFNVAYVRYNVGDFKRFTGNYSIDNEWNWAENDFDLIVYLDDNEEEPVIDTKVSRSTVETPLDIDVSSAQFITIKIETKDSRGCSLLLTDCYLNKDSSMSGMKTETKTTGTPLAAEKNSIKLTSIETPVECVGSFNIAQDILNTMGTTYEEAVVISDFNVAYVRYNVGDFSRFTANYSIDNEWNQAENDFSLQVYLDSNEEAPLIDTRVSRSTVETPLDIDVSSAQFITIKIETKDSRGCSLLLTDGTLSK